MEYKDFLAKLSKPAQRALANEGIDCFEKLETYTQKDLLSLHGFGPKSIPIVIDCLKNVDMELKK